MEKRIFLYPADLVVLTGKSYNTCLQHYHTLLDCLGKDKKKKITIAEYCRHEDVSEQEIKQALKIS